MTKYIKLGNMPVNLPLLHSYNASLQSAPNLKNVFSLGLFSAPVSDILGPFFNKSFLLISFLMGL